MDSAVSQAAKSIGVVNQICCLFENQSNVKHEKDYHTKQSSEKNFKLVLKVLEDRQVFSERGSRFHKSFKNIKRVLKQPSEVVSEWLDVRIQSYKW